MGLATQHIGKLLDGLQFWMRKPPKREMIHEVRVHLKKLRALWLIHPTGNTIAFRYSFPALHKLFKKAGSYRDLQTTLLCLESLPDWTQQNSLQQLLNKKIISGREKFKRILQKSSFKHKIAYELHKYYAYYRIASGFLLRSTRKHFREETLRLMVAADGTNDEQLHDVRKRIKSSLYQREAFPAKDNQTLTHPNIEAFQQLQDQLGKWHDWWFITQYLKQQSKESEEPGLKNLLEQAEKKTGLLKREVMRNLRKHAPAMVSAGITTMGDKQIIHLPQAKQKIARLQKKATN